MDYWVYFWTALGIGALHALEPGHGKSIMGAYLVMSQGRSRDAVVLGLTSAITHTLVIVFLAFMAHSATAMAVSNVSLPQSQTETWLKFISGAIIILVGLRMVFRRQNSCNCGCGHSHHKTGQKTIGKPRGKLLDVLLLGFTNGLMPCPSALAILLLSVSNGALMRGLTLVLAFGIGGAIALVTVGMVFVKLSSLAGGLFDRGAWKILPRFSGILICGLGIFTSYSAYVNL